MSAQQVEASRPLRRTTPRTSGTPRSRPRPRGGTRAGRDPPQRGGLRGDRRRGVGHRDRLPVARGVPGAPLDWTFCVALGAMAAWLPAQPPRLADPAPRRRRARACGSGWRPSGVDCRGRPSTGSSSSRVEASSTTVAWSSRCATCSGPSRASRARSLRHARLNQKLYGAALAVPLGLTTRVSGRGRRRPGRPDRGAVAGPRRGRHAARAHAGTDGRQAVERRDRRAPGHHRRRGSGARTVGPGGCGGPRARALPSPAPTSQSRRSPRGSRSTPRRSRVARRPHRRGTKLRRCARSSRSRRSRVEEAVPDAGPAACRSSPRAGWRSGPPGSGRSPGSATRSPPWSSATSSRSPPTTRSSAPSSPRPAPASV